MLFKVLIVLLISASSLFAHETVIKNEKYSITYDKDGLQDFGPMLTFKGEFVKGLSKAFIRAYARHPDVKMVAMSSPGGLLTEAYEVGRILSNYRAHTWVPRNAKCVSACALAFMGGETYKVSGILAFHAPYMPLYSGETSLDALYSEGQKTGSHQAYYFAAHGFRAQLYMMISQYTNKDTFVYIVSSSDLYSFMMYPERTYKEYLKQMPVSPGTVQGGDELMKAISERKYFEILRNNSEIDVFTKGTFTNGIFTKGSILSYKEMQTKFGTKAEKAAK